MLGIKPLLLLLKSLLPWCGIGGIIYLALCLGLRGGQNRLIFFPERPITVTPRDFQVGYEDIWIPVTTAAGQKETLHGWWIPARGRPTGVLLYLHGNGKNISANVIQALRFHQLGLSVFLFDYRGYGRSQGNFPTEVSVYQDAAIAWNYLTQKRQIPPQQIIIFGHSIGGAIAIQLAAQHPEAEGLIVQSSFTSMAEIAQLKGWSRFFPLDWLLHQRFDSLSRVSSLNLPVLYLHGTADSLVPDLMSQRLYAATPEPKQLVLIPGAGHNNVADIGGEEYMQVLRRFVSQVNVGSSKNK